MDLGEERLLFLKAEGAGLRHGQMCECVCVCARLGDGNRHADTLWDDGCDIGLGRRQRASMEEGAGWEEFHANATATFVGCQQHSQQFLEDISNRWVNSVF